MKWNLESIEFSVEQFMAVAPTDEVNAVSVSDDSSKEENVVSSTSSNV